MGPLFLIGNFLSCCITENMAASIDGVHCFGNIADLEAGIWFKVLAGCSLGQGEAAVGMTSMVAMVAMWQCGQVSAGRCLSHSLALSWCQHGPLLSLVWSLPPSALRVKDERPRLQITLVQTFIYIYIIHIFGTKTRSKLDTARQNRHNSPHSPCCHH